MGLAAPHRTAQRIHRASQGAETHCTSQGAETHCTSQGTGIPYTNAEELVVSASSSSSCSSSTQNNASIKHERLTLIY